MLGVSIPQLYPGGFGQRLHLVFLEFLMLWHRKINLNKRISQTTTWAHLQYNHWQDFFWPEGTSEESVEGLQQSSVTVVQRLSQKWGEESQETWQRHLIAKLASDEWKQELWTIRVCELTFWCWIKWAVRWKSPWKWRPVDCLIWQGRGARKMSKKKAKCEAREWSLQQHCGSIHHQGTTEFVGGQEKDVAVIETWGDESLDKNLTAWLGVRSASERC